VFVGVTSFITFLGQPGMFAKLPINYLLKDRLHFDPTHIASFLALAFAPAYFKPLIAVVTDAVPLFGTRRRHWFLLSMAAAAGCWLLATVPAPGATLLGVSLFCVMMGLMTAGTAFGAVLVEVGQTYEASGWVSSVRTFFTSLAFLAAGPASGFLATRRFFWTPLGGAAVAALLVPVGLIYLPERRTAARDEQIKAAVLARLKTALRARALWAAGALVFLVCLAPGLNTALFFYQTDTLKLSPGFIGNLGVFAGVGAIVGAALYAWACRRVRLRTSLIGSIGLAGIAALAYLFYSSPGRVIAITFAESLASALVLGATFDLALRATPRGCEGLGYAIVLSLHNVGVNLSNVIGSWLFQRLHHRLNGLTLVNAGSTLLALSVLPLLPSAILAARDGQTAGRSGARAA
jgi:hypothetical protein